ncbi:rod shape-determining protein MreC [Candidatus Nitrotoga sp. 1052]|uniref:rod shape-determining protein MreC n=1 Tax=Candidatus Nitrotoga sp. 1052 TaxID=2886964 RepID=UPI001EF56397|nr:rod shape-determining protein MreC [Candidatus Nitrotoga sp. 1052]CAH1088829.1 Cell shape-determining protein MreC [Candidatus Nitrotoga sp. 1052]
MEQNQPLRFFNRGPSPAVRLIFFALLSLLLLFVDVRYRYLESIRSGLSVLVYPLQRLVTAPSNLWYEVDAFFVSHNSLIRDNAELRNQHALDAAQLLQLEVLKAENQHLRNLLMVQQRADYPMQLAEIMYVERDIFNRKILLDKGTQANVLAGQIVMDDSGIVGQVTRVYPWMSEVTLITDKDHAVPVQVLRNGLRAVVFGSGDTGELALRYMPISSDIQNGDVLVTSGIDGTYPPGLPVAKVIRVERDPAYPFARILCAPIAGVDKQRQLLILSVLLKLPERPEVVVEAATGKPKNGRRGNR